MGMLYNFVHYIHFFYNTKLSSLIILFNLQCIFSVIFLLKRVTFVLSLFNNDYFAVL
eukprot:UN00034